MNWQLKEALNEIELLKAKNEGLRVLANGLELKCEETIRKYELLKAECEKLRNLYRKERLVELNSLLKTFGDETEANIHKTKLGQVGDGITNDKTM